MSINLSLDIKMNNLKPSVVSLISICTLLVSFNLLFHSNINVDNIDRSNSVSKTKSLLSIKSSDILQQTYITPTESKMYVDGSISNDTVSQCLSLPSFNSDENTVVVSYPVVIHNSPEFWDVAIQSAEDRGENKTPKTYLRSL